MSRFTIRIVLFLILQTNALQPEKCQRTPEEKHCLIEYSVRYRWPHTVRYVYNWYTRNCFEIRWSQHCPPPSVPATSNNFPSEGACLSQCGGWA